MEADAIDLECAVWRRGKAWRQRSFEPVEGGGGGQAYGALASHGVSGFGTTVIGFRVMNINRPAERFAPIRALSARGRVPMVRNCNRSAPRQPYAISTHTCPHKIYACLHLIIHLIFSVFLEVIATAFISKVPSTQEH